MSSWYTRTGRSSTCVAVMDGSENSAPGNTCQGSSVPEENKTLGDRKHCTSCDAPVKGHFGPCGPAKCIVGLLNKCSSRVGMST